MNTNYKPITTTATIALDPNWPVIGCCGQKRWDLHQAVSSLVGDGDRRRCPGLSDSSSDR